MAKNKNNQAIWNTRIQKEASNLFQKVGNSIDIDKRLYKEDIQGSIAHVEMLFRQKIISFKIKNKIIYGLNKIYKEITYKKFEFNKKYEDIHMNIEKRLFQIIGDEAGYIHTARSRNDQVVTDFKIWIKTATKDINNNIDKVIKSTIKLAEKNIETIMPGFTHLKNAQAISFGHYLMAYVEMFTRDKKRFLNKFQNLEIKFKKSEFFYLLIYRIVGGIPWQIQCLLPTLFNVKIINYFLATLIGIIPGMFLVVSIGSGFEKIIDTNTEVPGIKDIIFSPDIYLPLIGFFLLILTTIFFRKMFYKK